MKIYGFLYKLLARFLRFIYNVKIEGAENEPLDSAYVACANHLSNRDVLIMSISLKRQVRFFAKKELFAVPVLRGIIKTLGAFPVDRKSPAGAAAPLKLAVKLLDDGEVVGFFPQGKRCPKIDPRQTEIKNGIGLIAYRSKADVLPICIQTKGWKVLPFKRTYVRIGKPISADELNFSEGGNDEYKAASDYVFQKITALIVEEKPKKGRESRKC